MTKRTIAVYVDPEIADQIKRAANQAGAPVSAIAEKAFRNYLSEPEPASIERVLNLGMKRLDRTMTDQNYHLTVIAEFLPIILRQIFQNFPRIEDDAERARAAEAAEARMENTFALIEQRLNQGGLFAQLGAPVQANPDTHDLEDFSDEQPSS